MLETIYELNSYVFESRETYEKASKEQEMIKYLTDKMNANDPKDVLKVYNRFVSEKTFSTIIGYNFLLSLRSFLLENEFATEESLAEIPIREKKVAVTDTMPVRPNNESKFKRLYEGQIDRNKRLKIVVAALSILLIGFTIISIRAEYSVFTYFTNYKGAMEEELIDKYEKWEENLNQRENALNSNQDAVGDME